MQNGIDGKKLDELLKAHLITRIQHEAISSASGEEAVSIITTLIAEKVVMSEREQVSRLTAIIKKAVIYRTLDFQFKHEMPVTEIFDVWEEILSITGKSQEYKVSIVLSESTYGMIYEFVNSSAIPERLNTVHPLISTVFIAKENEAQESALQELRKIPGLELVYDQQKFIKKAEGSIVLCDDIDSDKQEIIDLISDVLEKGIFLVAPKFGAMDLRTISTIADAIDKSPIPDGTGVLHINGVLIPKPFNPIIKIGGECDRSPVNMPSGMEMPVLDLLNMLGGRRGQ